MLRATQADPLFQIAAEASVFLDCPGGPFVIPPAPFERGKFSLIVPTYREAENVQRFLAAVCAVLDRRLPPGYEVIVVDDNSPDGTWSRAARIALSLPAVRVIRRTGERGLASAVIRGYQAATGEFLGTINADFQHPPRVLAGMLDLVRDADVVVASRFCQGGGTGDWEQERLLVSWAASLAGRMILPRVFDGLSDPLSGCYLFRRSVVDGIPLSPTGFKSLIEILARGRGATVAEYPYVMRSRQFGKSKATLSTSLAYLRQLRRLRSLDAA